MPFDHSGYWIPPDTVYPYELQTQHPPGYVYRCTIPEVTTQNPGELLGKLYSDKEKDRDWTDSTGVLCKQQETYRLYPRYAVRPIGSSGLVGKWPRPNGLRAEPVPANGGGPFADRLRNSQFNGAEIVDFKNQDPESPSTGVSLFDICQGRSESLKGAGDVVYGALRGKDMDFIIKWPGYQLEKFNIHSMLGGRPLTRFALAEQITMAYACFFRKVEDEFLLPSDVGFYDIALHQGINSKEDSLGVQFIQLYLVRFYYAAIGNWVAEIDIV